jgi:hypothetical protein
MRLGNGAAVTATASWSSREVKKVGEILQVIAVQGNRLDTIDRRQDAQDRLIDESPARRGGFILPVVRPPGS